MRKYAKIINDKTKEVIIGEGNNYQYYASQGFKAMDVVQSYDNRWFVEGYEPEKPAPTIDELKDLRARAYAEEIDPLHAKKFRKTILGEWSEEDEIMYKREVKRLSEEIAERYPY